MHCWSHLLRGFVRLVRNSKSPIAEAAVRQIAQLYAIEATSAVYPRTSGWPHAKPAKNCSAKAPLRPDA